MAQTRDPREEWLTEETIAALATPPGRSALGIVRLTGPRCREIAAFLLGPQPLEPRRATVRVLGRARRTVDRVVATFWSAPATATGEDLLEITAHGSPEILRDILEGALEAGARAAAPGEFTRRAFLNGRIDLPQARAVADLISARGTAARSAAMARLEGGLARALDDARTPIVALLARISARLDHPDADLPSFPDADALAALGAAESLLERLLSGYERGRTRREGARIGLFGRPNAGKSSLLNALLGRARAITAAQPGTTRDVLEEQAELAGTMLTLIDTAGLREGATDAAEREGIARAEAALASCSVAVLVVDAARACDEDDVKTRAAISEAAARAGARMIVALNKMDLVGGSPMSQEGVPCSALTGVGLPELEAAITEAAGGAADEGEALLSDAQTRDSILEACKEVRAARAEAHARPNAWEDRAAQRLRRALAHLDAARGADASQDVLNEIFSRFCIGK